VGGELPDFAAASPKRLLLRKADIQDNACPLGEVR
jgi:hypothetical protein